MCAKTIGAKGIDAKLVGAKVSVNKVIGAKKLVPIWLAPKLHASKRLPLPTYKSTVV